MCVCVYVCVCVYKSKSGNRKLLKNYKRVGRSSEIHDIPAGLH